MFTPNVDGSSRLSNTLQRQNETVSGNNSTRVREGQEVERRERGGRRKRSEKASSSPRCLTVHTLQGSRDGDTMTRSGLARRTVAGVPLTGAGFLSGDIFTNDKRERGECYDKENSRQLWRIRTNEVASFMRPTSCAVSAFLHHLLFQSVFGYYFLTNTMVLFTC